MIPRKGDAKPEVKAESKPLAGAEPKPEAEPKREARAEPKREAMTEPKPVARTEPKPEPNVTPQLVARVHELYEELGREDVRSVEDWEKAERDRGKDESHKGTDADSTAGHGAASTRANPGPRGEDDDAPR